MSHSIPFSAMECFYLKNVASDFTIHSKYLNIVKDPLASYEAIEAEH